MQFGRDNLLDDTVSGAIGRTSCDGKASGESIQCLGRAGTVRAFLYKHAGKLDSWKSPMCLGCDLSSKHEGGARRC